MKTVWDIDNPAHRAELEVYTMSVIRTMSAYGGKASCRHLARVLNATPLQMSRIAKSLLARSAIVATDDPVPEYQSNPKERTK